MKQLCPKQKKSLFYLVFQNKSRTFPMFILNQKQYKNSFSCPKPACFPYVRKCETSEIFTNLCQLKARCANENFATKRRNSLWSFLL